MDFKELLSLAKDNQSFAMKKFQRDNIEKAKTKKSAVSDSAIKEFMAKRKQMEEQRKAAEQAERHKRIMTRLDSEQGKKKKVKEKSSTNDVEKQRGSKVDSCSQIVLHRNDPTKSATTENRSRAIHGTDTKKSFQIPKKNANEGRERSSKGPIGINESNLQSASSGESGTGKLKQYKRRKGVQSDFEWSGSASYAPDSGSNRKEVPSISKLRGTKSTSVPSFQELMDIAKQQKDKPATVHAKTVVEAKIKGSKSEESTESALNLATSIIRKDGKHGLASESKDQNSRVMGKTRKISAREDIKDQISRQNRCTVTTHTVNVKSNYDAAGNFISAQYKNGHKSRIHSAANGMKVNGHCTGSYIGSKRTKMSSIDKELEMERIQLERKRNLLRMKLQGAKGNHGQYEEYEGPDDCYDDLDDFIDDEGEEFDYSKHIRGIFGYDRRKFIDEDDDLKDMESNYRQIAAEEARSARIGKLEDEIERRKEEMEKRKAKKLKN